VYEALLAIINGDEIGSWRSGATRVILLMGDAPPHEEGDDTSYYSGHDHQYTASDVISAAKSKNVIICAIVVSGDLEAEEKFAELADGTGCEAFTVEEADEVSEKIEDVVDIAIEEAKDDADDDSDFSCCFGWASGSATKLVGYVTNIF